MEISMIKNQMLIDRQNLIESQLYNEEKIELRETESARNECLKQLKNWIQQNPHIENCITDDNFLLRFLRARKYSIPMAQQTLLKYLNFRQMFPSVLCNLDYTEPKTLDLIEKGYIYASPFRDRHGRRVVLYNFSAIDVTTVTGLDIQRADAVTFETLLEDEDCQVMGVTHVLQAGNVSPALIPLFYTKDFGYLIKWGEQSFPMRHKLFAVTSLSTIARYVFEATKSLITSKLRNRIWMDESLEKLHEQLGARCLPLELGGLVPADEMISLWKDEMQSKRHRLMSFDRMKLLTDEGIVTRRSAPKDDPTGSGSISGSFRRLEFD